MLALTGCGGSGICARWDNRVGADAVAALHQGQQFAGQFQGIDPPQQLAASRRQVAQAYFKAEIAQDLSRKTWRSARGCPIPPIQQAK
jgi:hypothetical protein